MSVSTEPAAFDFDAFLAIAIEDADLPATEIAPAVVAVARFVGLRCGHYAAFDYTVTGGRARKGKGRLLPPRSYGRCYQCSGDGKEVEIVAA